MSRTSAVFVRSELGELEERTLLLDWPSTNPNCPLPCSECSRHYHHFNDFYCTDDLQYVGCKHCDAVISWEQYWEASDDD